MKLLPEIDIMGGIRTEHERLFRRAESQSDTGDPMPDRRLDRLDGKPLVVPIELPLDDFISHPVPDRTDLIHLLKKSRIKSIPSVAHQAMHIKTNLWRQ